jgi:O-antigen ligase/tetratricopeptide (TPR) repeat protein
MVALLAACPVAFARNTIDGFEQVKVWLLITAALGLLALSRVHIEERTSGPRRPTMPSVVAFVYLGAATVSTVFSVSPAVSFFGADESYSGLVVVAALVVLFQSARRIGSTVAHRHALVASMLVGAATAAAYGAAQALGLDPLPWQRLADFGGRVRAFGTLGHPNHLGGVMAMVLPLQIWFVGTARARGRRGAAALLALGAVLSAGCLAATLSRAAWVAGLVGVALHLSTSPTWNRWRLALAGVAFVALVSGSLLLGGKAAPASFTGAVAERVLGLGDPGPRTQIWRAAGDAFRESPIRGNGLDTFGLAFERHRPPLFWAREYDATPTKAHNDLLHALATQGTLGGAAFLLAAGGGIVLGLRALRVARDEERRLASALVSGWVAFLVLTLTGFAVVAETSLLAVGAALLVDLAKGASPSSQPPDATSGIGWWVPGLAATAAFAAGWLSGQVPLGPFPWPLAVPLLVFGTAVAMAWAAAATVASSPDAGPAGGRSEGVTRDVRPGIQWATPSRIAWSVGLAAAWLYLVARPYAASVAARSAEAAPMSRERIALLEKAAALEPLRVRYGRRLGLAMTEMDAPGEDHAERESWLRRSREVLAHSARLVPADGYGWASLAVPETRLAVQGELDREQPFRTFEQAFDRDPRNVTFRLAAANAALELGDLARARHYASEAAGMLPTFGPALAQLAHVTAREGRLDEAIRLLRIARAGEWYGQTDAHQVAEANLASLLIRARLFEEAASVARALAHAAPAFGPGHYQLARALEGLGQWPDAKAEYEAVLRLDPFDGGARKALDRGDARSPETGDALP